MSREGLISERFQRLGRFNTPTLGIVFTAAGMALVVVAFDVSAVAKLASAFVLLTLGLVNLAVIVLRLSQIRSYAPGFSAPFFPWLQLFGIGVSVYLIVELGALALALVGGSILGALAWYWFYGRFRVTRLPLTPTAHFRAHLNEALLAQRPGHRFRGNLRPQAFCLAVEHQQIGAVQQARDSEKPRLPVHAPVEYDPGPT